MLRIHGRALGTAESLSEGREVLESAVDAGDGGGVKVEESRSQLHRMRILAPARGQGHEEELVVTQLLQSGT